MDTEISRAEEMIRVCREQEVELGIIFKHRFDTPIKLQKEAIRILKLIKIVY